MLHDNEVRVDADTATQLIRDQFPTYVDDQIHPLYEGTDNAVFQIGESASARFPLRNVDPQVCFDALRREASALNELSICCPVPTPKPIGIGQPGHGYPMPWAVQSWVVGNTATPQGFRESEAFALDIANLISTFRQANTKGRSFFGSGRGGRIRDHEGWVAICLQNSEGLVDVPPLKRLWKRFRDLSAPNALAMCHKDLIPANLLVEGDRLVGVLDGGRFGPADPALDLVAAWHLFDATGREVLRTQIGCDEAEWLRGAGWAFEQAMGLAFYYNETHPRMAALGRSTLNRIITASEFCAD
jgi:aminoglycoside phosphotransferase (APT) family kinase protein